jgi:hypothetical protein
VPTANTPRCPPSTCVNGAGNHRSLLILAGTKNVSVSTCSLTILRGMIVKILEWEWEGEGGECGVAETHVILVR